MQTLNPVALEINEYTDTDYNPDSSFRYSYYLVISAHEMTAVIADGQASKLLQLKTFKAGSELNFLEADYDTLKDFSEITSGFKPAYKNKKVIMVDDHSILAPEPLTNIVELEKYYSLNYKIMASSQVLFSKLNIFHTTCIFNVRNETLKFIRFNMPTADIIHGSQLFIKACEALNEEYAPGRLFIQVHHNYLEILQLSKTQILFYNTFRFDGDTDAVYYVLAVAEQLGIMSDLSVLLFGNLDANHTLFSLLRKYCQQLKFGDRLSRFRYPDSFGVIPGQFYFHASSVLLCE